jgi:AraC family transcriptional regulator of adaptative response/methylated-DNA-[protein]-cysteine methyltransferase
VASTATGVCAILLGDDPEALVRDVQDCFENAELIEDDSDFERLVSRVIGLVEAPGMELDLPLDVRGTVFQQQVWRALSEMPVGSTATYAEIDERVSVAGGSQLWRGRARPTRWRWRFRATGWSAKMV